MSLLDDFPFVGDSLTDIAHAHLLFDRFPQYRALLEWIEGFVLRPDARLGRPGAVCPRLAPSIDQNLVTLVAVATTGSGVDEALDTVPLLAHAYVELFGGCETAFRRGALLAVFPDIDPAEAEQFIDGGHAAVRAQFVRHGLMLGEFHRTSSVGSVHDSSFKVMGSPVPMFAVRAMTTHDILFLDRPGPQRDELMGHYLHHIGGHVRVNAIDPTMTAHAVNGR
ncbi:DUF6875 domain-containing protein [Nocardia takedensis]|uniref:DUF6875 domain-containing protein n=1 Tax=Nocardia takedensis TaxID=259390 RepID=UPI003F76E4A7